MGNNQNKMSVDDRDHQRRTVGEIKQASKQVGVGNDKSHVPGEGIRSMKTSNAFRALNFELYAKPSKPVMFVGVTTFSLCVAYMTYMRFNYNKEELYESLADDGTTVLRPRKSRWES